jgi:flagellar export protein FliJ
MTKKFRLQSLLKLRCRERDSAGKDVSDAQAAIALVDAQIAEIESEQLHMERMRRQASGGAVSLTLALDAERYQMVLAANHSQIAQDRSLLVQELERRQAKLVLKQQAVKVLEKLEENQRTRLAESDLKREQATLDDWSQTIYSNPIQRLP